MQSTETWKAVIGYEGIYEVSDHGRVRSLNRLSPHGRFGIVRLTGKVLRPGNNGKGHMFVNMKWHGATRKDYIYRLALEAFRGPCPHGMEALHHDGNPENNRIDNLRWGTRQDNKNDSRRLGETACGERLPQSRLTENDVRDIRRRLTTGASQSHLAREYGVDQSAISLIKSRRTWAHVKAVS